MLQDLRYALRNLAATPAFALVAVGSLAIGIGINTTIFSVVNAVLLRPLPVAKPEQLVDIYTTSSTDHSTSSWADFRDLREGTTVFDGLIGHSLMFANVSRDGRSRLLMGEVVSANYFDVLGVRAAIGRMFAPEEDQTEGGNRLVVVGDGFWRREFGGDAGVVGRPLRIRGLDYTIVGVAPARFTGMMPGISADLWIPASMVDEVEPVGMNDAVPSPTGRTRIQRRGQRWMFIKGRLKPDVSIAQAQTEVAAVMTRLEREYPQTNRNRRGVLIPASDVRIHPMVDGALMPGAMLLMVAVSLVLVIACANIANMLLARATIRTREIAVRVAIGASRWRIVRQLLTESLLLAVLGGWCGLLLAKWTTGFIAAFQPPLPVAISLDLAPDWRVFAFAVALVLATGAVFGLAPALQATSPDLVASLKNDVAPGFRARRFGLRNLLVVAQVAVCFVLLVGAGLLLRSLSASRNANVGFEPAGLVVATVDMGMHRYSPERGQAFYESALQRIQGLPGVRAAALAERLPFSPNIHAQNVFIDGRQYAPDDLGVTTDVTRVSAGYFRTLGIPLLQGREFDDRDTPSSSGVVIVNDAFARRYWPGESAVGKRIRVRSATGPMFEVVGVASDHKVRTIGEEPRPFVHFSRGQAYNPSASFLARTDGDTSQLVQAMRRELGALEPDLVFLELQPMESVIGTTLFPARMGALVLSGTGAIALLLSAMGLYGLIAFTVSRRTREIGVRMALGAHPRVVLSLIVRQGMGLVLFGLAAGLMCAVILTHAMAGALYSVSPIDVTTYLAAAIVLAGVALAANLVPAIRASRIDPMVALRTN
jgi:putative ABC transport system permease protein